jgi:hypothetical protein
MRHTLRWAEVPDIFACVRSAARGDHGFHSIRRLLRAQCIVPNLRSHLLRPYSARPVANIRTLAQSFAGAAAPFLQTEPEMSKAALQNDKWKLGIVEPFTVSLCFHRIKLSAESWFRPPIGPNFAR